MNVATGDRPSKPNHSAAFPATRWSLVRSSSGDDTVASDAMSELCRLYWYPLYVFARRQGLSPEDAEDATQGFLARVIEKEYLTKARSERGTLRSFLLKGLKYFLANERKAARRLKRGGGGKHFSLDADEAESRFQRELAINDSPDRLFDRKWATSVIERALSGVKEDYAEKGKEAIFHALKPALAGRGDHLAPYAEMGKELGLSEGAVKVAVYRLRQRFREILRQHIAQTVASEDEVEEEILFLFRAFARNDR